MDSTAPATATDWPTVSQSPGYQALSPQDQLAAKLQYFNQVVTAKPEFQQLSPADQQSAQKQFFGGTLQAPSTPQDMASAQAGTQPLAVAGQGLKNMGQDIAQGAGQAASTLGKDVSGIASAVTHPADMVAGAIKPFQDVANDPIGQVKQFGKDISNPGQLISDAGKSVSDMVMNKPLETLSMLAPGAVGDLANAAGKVAGSAGSAISKSLNPDYDAVLNSNAQAYQKILNPGKNILNSENIDVGNATRTLADNGIIIKKDINNKLDNSQGIQQLQDANKPLYDQAQQIIKSNPNKTFDLDQIAVQAKANVSQFIKNAEERINAKNQIDNLVHAEIMENGGSSLVTAPQLMTIKQGMYERAFQPLNPTANDGARSIGSVIKSNIEQAFPNSPVADINNRIGNNLEAQTLLEKTNGNVVQGGKLGQAVGRLVGATAGGGVGTALGPVGTGTGALLGQEAGARSVDYLNDPERITTAMANKMSTVKPAQQPINLNIPAQPIKGLPSPNSVSPTGSNIPPLNPQTQGRQFSQGFTQPGSAMPISMPAPIAKPDIENAIAMGNHAAQNNIQALEAGNKNVVKFNNQDLFNHFAKDNMDKIQLISTDSDGNFYAHLKGK